MRLPLGIALYDRRSVAPAFPNLAPPSTARRGASD